MSRKHVCSWCGYDYKKEIIQSTESAHLSQCLVFQGLPVAEMRNGEEFVQHPKYPNIFVQRSKVN